MIYNYKFIVTKVDKDASSIAFAMSKLVISTNKLNCEGIVAATLSVNTQNNIGKLIIQFIVEKEELWHNVLNRLELLLDKISSYYNVKIKKEIISESK